jgi:hypothetical protein
MSKYITAWTCLGVWAVAASSAWTTLVPGVLSASTFAWCNLGVALVVLVVVATTFNALPTRSVTHVLHDAEEASSRRA